MRLPNFTNSLIVRLQHLSHHNLCERVFMHAAGSFVDEHIVVDLCETRNAVHKWYGGVESEESEVEVSTSHVFTLEGV